MTTQPQADGHPRPLEAGRGREGPPGAFGGSRALGPSTLASGSRSGREWTSGAPSGRRAALCSRGPGTRARPLARLGAARGPRDRPEHKGGARLRSREPDRRRFSRISRPPLNKRPGKGAREVGQVSAPLSALRHPARLQARLGGAPRHPLSRKAPRWGAVPTPTATQTPVWQLAVPPGLPPIFWASEGTGSPTIPKDPMGPAPHKAWAWIQPVPSSGPAPQTLCNPKVEQMSPVWLKPPERTVRLGKRGPRAGQNLGPRHCAGLWGQGGLSGLSPSRLLGSWQRLEPSLTWALLSCLLPGHWCLCS